MKKYIISILLALLLGNTAKSQLTPMKSQFFHNPYLVNSAMAGAEGRTTIFANYSNQWNKIEGSPVMMSLSAATLLNSRASIRVNIINDQSGLMSRTQAMGSFSYRLPFGERHNLRLGVSLSWSQDRLDMGLASGSASADPTLGRYNDRENYLDGNFGISYQLKGFEGQFSYLNLNQKRMNRFSTVDYATFYSSVSYLIPLDGFTVKPLFAYRGVKSYDNQWDAAAEWKVSELCFNT